MRGDGDRPREPWIVRAAPYASGGFFAAGWWTLADAWLVARPLEFLHVVPGLVGTFGFVLAALTPFRALRQGDDAFWAFAGGGDERFNGCARCWLFAAFVVSLAAVMTGVVLATTLPDGTPRQDPAPWPTVAATLQAVCLLAASLAWIARQLNHANADDGT
jgi:hypothetical protein